MHCVAELPPSPRIHRLIRCAAFGLPLLAGCGLCKRSTPDSASASVSASASAAAHALPATAALGAPSSADDAPEIQHRCEHTCELECASEASQRKAFYETKRAKVASSPFRVEVDRVFLEGSCARGDVPEKRPDADGVKVVVEGKLTYTGADLLGYAVLSGSAYLRFGDRYAEADAVERSRSMWSGSKLATRVLRPVRGADPWIKDQTREFHWESQPYNPVFCEAVPDAAEAYLQLIAGGISTGREDYALQMVPIRWEEVVGMAVRQKVTIRKASPSSTVYEPADALFSKLDRLLITNASGKTEWVPRTSVVQTSLWQPAAATSFPAEAKSPQWTVRVKSVKSEKDHGGYSPAGEDQFLTLVDVDLVSTASAPDDGKAPKPAKVRDFSFRLETSPGNWASPLKQPLGLLDGATEIAVGGTASGTLAFPRQRFERPTRLEIKTPDRATVVVEVFSTDIGPERAPK